jgi:hypothetical protein
LLVKGGVIVTQALEIEPHFCDLLFLLERQTIGIFKHDEYTHETIQSNGILYPTKSIEAGKDEKRDLYAMCSGIIMLFVFCVQIIQGTNHEQMFASHEPTTSVILMDKKVAQA